MTTKKICLGACLLTAIGATTAQSSTYNGKTTAMSDAGVATSNYLEGMDLNPAALATFADNDDFNLRLNLGAVASDEDELLDNAQDLADLLDEAEMLGENARTANELIVALEAINGNRADVNGGGGLYMNIPTRWASVGLYGKTELTVDVLADVADSDIAFLQEIVDRTADPSYWADPNQMPEPFDSSNLDSAIIATGAAVTELGLTIAKTSGNIAYGVTLKNQQVEVIEYIAKVGAYDEDDFEADDYTTEDSNLNVDLGIQAGYGNWLVGATVANAIKGEYQSISGREIVVEPRITLGGGYRNGWFTLAVDLDATAVPNLVNREESQLARIGLEMNAWGWAQLRAGYKTDLESAMGDTASVGIGFSPFGILNLDVSAVQGENDNVGAALQLGFSF